MKKQRLRCEWVVAHENEARQNGGFLTLLIYDHEMSAFSVENCLISNLPTTSDTMCDLQMKMVFYITS